MKKEEKKHRLKGRRKMKNKTIRLKIEHSTHLDCRTWMDVLITVNLTGRVWD